MIEPGPWDECCPFCLQRYLYEEEYRCARCDAALCPACVVLEVEGGEARCPDCAAEPEAGRRP